GRHFRDVTLGFVLAHPQSASIAGRNATMTCRRWMTAGLLVVVAQTLVAAVGVSAESWTRAYVNALPHGAFAVVHVWPDGTRSRHLPHHDANGRLDLPHLRSALARLDPVHWEDPADAERARQHLLMHWEALDGHRRSAPSLADGHAR